MFVKETINIASNTKDLIAKIEKLGQIQIKPK